MTEGYSVKVHAAQANVALFTEMQQDHTLALANLASRQNIGRAAHEGDIRAVGPSRYPDRKTRDSTIRERPAE